MPFVIVAIVLAAYGGYQLMRYRVIEQGIEIKTKATVPSTFAGSYLAARFASQAGDLKAASHYSDNALKHSGKNVALLFDSLRRFVAAGSMERAVEAAKTMQMRESIDPLASMVMLSHYAKEKDYKVALAAMGEGADGGLYTLVAPLFAQWLRVDYPEGAEAAPRADMEQLLTQAGFLLPFVEYHHALLLDYQGQPEEALAAFLRAKGEPDVTPYRVTQVMANFYLRHGKKDEAQALFDAYREHHPSSGLIPTEIPDFDLKPDEIKPVVSTPAEGVAELFFTTASLLFAEQATDEALIYLRLALYLRPDLPPAQLMLANVLEQMKDYSGAIAVYDSIDPNTVFYRRGLVRSALNYEMLGDTKRAVSLLERYAVDYPNDIEAYSTLGDIYRSKKQFERAVQAYGAAIKRRAPWSADDWELFYARGMSFERAGHWEKAEADFKQALSLQPKQPDVLNYLGYSWLIQDKHIKKAKRYIEQAVEQRPYDAHIIDSMGWAHYLTGDYLLAVDYLEQAVELAPQDATINDHLGDAYWRVGRKIEAEFQWERALTFKPEAEDERAILQKLEQGLPDAVLMGSAATKIDEPLTATD